MRRLVTTTALAALLTAGLATAAAAAPPAGTGGSGKPSGVACQQRGIATLQGAGLLPHVAANGIEVKDVGTLPFRTVLALHRSNPELFQTGGVTVVLPGGAELPATWCDGV